MMVMCHDYPVAKVTSGDWGDEHPDIRLVGSSFERRAEAYMVKDVYGSVSEETAKANARLISAAPDCYEALRDLLRHYVELVNSGDLGNWDPETEIVVKDARIALAKAVPTRTPQVASEGSRDEITNLFNPPTQTDESEQ